MGGGAKRSRVGGQFRGGAEHRHGRTAKKRECRSRVCEGAALEATAGRTPGRPRGTVLPPGSTPLKRSPEPDAKAAAKRELQLQSLPEHLQPKRSKGLAAAEGGAEKRGRSIRAEAQEEDLAVRSAGRSTTEREPGWSTER